MKITIVASGSKGNAVLLTSKNTLIQIDMGVPLKRIKEALLQLGKKQEDIKAIFITHEHSDHVGTLNLYHEKIPVFASEGTIPNADYLVESFQPITIGDFNIVPFSTSHDAANPMGYLFEADGERLGYVTDTGCLNDEALLLLKDSDYFYFESNHDLKMLRESDRPEILKRRIHSKHGHLSNLASAKYMAKLIGPRTKKIFLAHLSEECNTPEKALETYQKTLKEKHVDFSNIKIIPAAQWEITKED